MLLIEDDEQQQALISSMLQASGFSNVREAGSAEEGLKIFGDYQPDVVLLDIQLPGMNGIDCLKNILNRKPKTCVIMLSANDLPQTIEDCLDAGAYNFISKVTPAIELALKVKTIWRNYQDR